MSDRMSLHGLLRSRDDGPERSLPYFPWQCPGTGTNAPRFVPSLMRSTICFIVANLSMRSPNGSQPRPGSQASLDQVRDTTTPFGLLAEQVGLGLLGEGRLDNIRRGVPPVPPSQDRGSSQALAGASTSTATSGVPLPYVGLADLVVEPLGATMMTSWPAGTSIAGCVADVEAVLPRRRAEPSFQVGSNLLGMGSGAGLVGSSTETTSPSATAPATSLTSRPAASAQPRRTNRARVTTVNSGIPLGSACA